MQEADIYNIQNSTSNCANKILKYQRRIKSQNIYISTLNLSIIIIKYLQYLWDF